MHTIRETYAQNRIPPTSIIFIEDIELYTEDTVFLTRIYSKSVDVYCVICESTSRAEEYRRHSMSRATQIHKDIMTHRCILNVPSNIPKIERTISDLEKFNSLGLDGARYLERLSINNREISNTILECREIYKTAMVKARMRKEKNSVTLVNERNQVLKRTRIDLSSEKSDDIAEDPEEELNNNELNKRLTLQLTPHKKKSDVHLPVAKIVMLKPKGKPKSGTGKRNKIDKSK